MVGPLHANEGKGLCGLHQRIKIVLMPTRTHDNRRKARPAGGQKIENLGPKPRSRTDKNDDLGPGSPGPVADKIAGTRAEKPHQ
jgi:hypothetical protein